jgi:hypothetical protein
MTQPRGSRTTAAGTVRLVIRIDPADHFVTGAASCMLGSSGTSSRSQDSRRDANPFPEVSGAGGGQRDRHHEFRFSSNADPLIKNYCRGSG